MEMTAFSSLDARYSHRQLLLAGLCYYLFSCMLTLKELGLLTSPLVDCHWIRRSCWILSRNRMGLSDFSSPIRRSPSTSTLDEVGRNPSNILLFICSTGRRFSITKRVSFQFSILYETLMAKANKSDVTEHCHSSWAAIAVIDRLSAKLLKMFLVQFRMCPHREHAQDVDCTDRIASIRWLIRFQVLYLLSSVSRARPSSSVS